MAEASRRYRPEAPSVVELAAGALVQERGGSRILILHHARQRRWCFPKGHVEAGESLRTAAAREVEEETGLRSVRFGPELLTVAYRFYDPARRRNVLKTTVYFRATSPAEGVRPERLFDDARWVPPSEARRQVRYATDRAAVDALTLARARADRR